METLRKIQNYATQRYTPGGSVTEANPGPMYGTGPDLMSILASMRGRQPAAAGMGARMNTGRPSTTTNVHPQQSPLQAMEESARMKQLEATMNPQPLRMVSGPGIVPGYTPDTLAMNAYQRQAYLPAESKNDPQADAIAENIRANTAAQEFEDFRKRSGGAARGR